MQVGGAAGKVMVDVSIEQLCGCVGGGPVKLLVGVSIEELCGV